MFFLVSLIPAKVWREWNALFVSDRPFFDDEQQDSNDGQRTLDRQDQKLHAQTVLEEESLKILDEGDFNEYRNMIGEWEPPAASQSATAITHIPPLDNPIFGFIVNRLHNLVHPPAVCLSFEFVFERKELLFVKDVVPPPLFPAFGLKMLVLGKSFAGKSTILKRYGEGTRIFETQTFLYFYLINRKCRHDSECRTTITRSGRSF